MIENETTPSGKPYNPLDSVAIPGQSLTKPKGEYPWEKSPKHTSPDTAIAEIMDKMSTPENMGRLFALLENGVTVTAMTNAIVMSAFATGSFNPNIAELIKPDLREFIMLLAEKADIDFKEGSVKPSSPFDKTLDELKNKNEEVKNSLNPKEPADVSDEEPVEDSNEESKGLMLRDKPASLMDRGVM
jgi:hypothetical protein